MFYPNLYYQYRKQFRGFYYTVQPQESIEIISKRYRIPVHNIIYANNLTYPYILNEGDRVFLPGIDEPVASGGVVVHTVKFGENIDAIASKYGIISEEIMEKNYLTNKNMTFVGQKLLIPDKGKYIEGDVVSQKNEVVEDKEEEIRVFPYSPYIPKPGSPGYENTKSLSNRLPVLKRGVRDSEVIKFQRLASAIGYKFRKADGYFSHEVENIVKEIQRKAGITETGIVDGRVWEYVFSKVNSVPGMMG